MESPPTKEVFTMETRKWGSTTYIELIFKLAIGRTDLSQEPPSTVDGRNPISYHQKAKTDFHDSCKYQRTLWFQPWISSAANPRTRSVRLPGRLAACKAVGAAPPRIQRECGFSKDPAFGYIQQTDRMRFLWLSHVVLPVLPLLIRF